MSYNSSSDQSSLPSSPMALVSLVAGILGLTFVPFMGSIIAVITGNLAQKEIRESAGTLGGEGQAKAGIILGWVGIGLGIIGLCAGGIVMALTLCIIPYGIIEQSSWMLPGLIAVV